MESTALAIGFFDLRGRFARTGRVTFSRVQVDVQLGRNSKSSALIVPFSFAFELAPLVGQTGEVMQTAIRVCVVSTIACRDQISQ